MSMLHIVNEMRHTAKVPNHVPLLAQLSGCPPSKWYTVSDHCQSEDVPSSVEDTEKVIYPPSWLDVWCLFLTMTAAIAD